MATIFNGTSYTESQHGDLQDNPQWIFGAGTSITGVASITPNDSDGFILDHTGTGAHPNAVAAGTTVQFSVSASNVQGFDFIAVNGATNAVLFR